MPSTHEEARSDRGTAQRAAGELLLTGVRLPRFVLLLAAMLAELTLAPLIDLLPRGLAVVQAITALVLLAALLVAGAHRVAVVLFILSLGVRVAASISPIPALEMAAQALRVLFLCYVVGVVFRRVLSDRAVTLDTVAGAACIYIMIGLLWGDLYMVLEFWRPGSFYVPPTWTHAAGSSMRASLTYFSFATLTTLGYGEVHPGDPAAGSLCAAEGLLGQLYLAIMIARLVGLHASRAPTDGREREAGS